VPVKIVDRATLGASSTVIPSNSGDFIQLPVGASRPRRIMFPIYFDGVGHGSETSQAVCYTDDYTTGISGWTVGGVAYTTTRNPSENALTFRPDGSLIMTVREATGTNRYYTESTDGGETWAAYAELSSFTATTCNASMLQTDPTGAVGASGVVYWNGPTASGRAGFQMKRSLDGGLTYPSTILPFVSTELNAYNSTKLISAALSTIALATEQASVQNTDDTVHLRLMKVA
jgi:hypothetical protein